MERIKSYRKYSFRRFIFMALTIFEKQKKVKF